jgi:hypothetical protein
MEKKVSEKLPDSVAFDPERNLFDSFIKPYATSVSGPRIDLPNVALFRENNLAKTNHKFTKRADEIKEQIIDLYKEFQDNELIWNSQLSFEPNIGSQIFLYKKENQQTFCSMISPEEWNNKFECLGHFRLDSDFSWKRINR